MQNKNEIEVSIYDITRIEDEQKIQDIGRYRKTLYATLYDRLTLFFS